jgi:hypothetical protein
MFACSFERYQLLLVDFFDKAKFSDFKVSVWGYDSNTANFLRQRFASGHTIQAV